MRNATDCRNNCVSGDDGYLYCDWDQGRAGCRQNDWLNDEKAMIYRCPMRRGTPPLLMFNGKLDPLTNISGVVDVPTDPSNLTTYYENYSPINYVWEHFAKAYGCGEARVSFTNGTAGNSTTCFSFQGCISNVTYCLSDAGHYWYGDVISRRLAEEVFEFGGYNLSDPSAPVPQIGPPTLSVRVSEQILLSFEQTRGAGLGGS